MLLVTENAVYFKILWHSPFKQVLFIVLIISGRGIEHSKLFLFNYTALWFA